MSKKMFMVLAMTVVLVFAATGAAFAAWGDNTYGTGFIGNPHGSYTSATTKCGVCHAVHGASAAGEALLQSTKANSCTYCHITSGLYTTVYGGNAANYSVATNMPNAHNTVSGATQYSGTVGCPDCHTVHGNNSVTITDGGAGMATAASNLRNLFVDARGASFRAIRGANYSSYYLAGNATLMTDWCSQCHPYKNTGATSGVTHRMAPADGAHAFVKSSDCRDCHDSLTTGATYTFPHMADGARFLKVASAVGVGVGNAAANGSGRVVADGACLKCHVNATATSGVGVTF